MTIVADAAFCAIAALFGYQGIRWYLAREELEGEGRSFAQLSSKKYMYFLAVFSACAIWIVFFETRYALPLLSQMRLLGLLLLLFPCAVVDGFAKKIPNRFLVVGLIVWSVFFGIELILQRETAMSSIVDSLTGATILGAFFLLMRLLFKNSIGVGDIKLLMMIGLYQGLQGAMSSIFFSMFALFLTSVFLLLTKRKERKDTLPFCPSVLVGTILSVAMTGM